MRLFSHIALTAAARTSVVAFGLGAVVNLVLQFAGVPHLPWSTLLIVLFIVAPLAGLISAFLYQATIAERVRGLVEILDDQNIADAESAKQLPQFARDEFGELADTINTMLSNVSALQSEMVKREHELRTTRKELVLHEELAQKSSELERNLRERALLFDVMRISSSEQDLETVLHLLARRLAAALRLREVVLLLVETEAPQLVVRASFGFASPNFLNDRAQHEGDDPFWHAVKNRQPSLLNELPDFENPGPIWSQFNSATTMSICPIIHRGEVIGVLAATRHTDNEFSSEDQGLLTAMSDQMALSIRHAQLFDELRRGSQQDDLTGLGNRRLLRERLEDEIHRSRRFGLPTSVMIIDIDWFKKLNDQSGHSTGDQALKHLAQLLKKHLRRVDTVARVGGEEFVALLPRTSIEEAAKVGEKIRQLVESTDFPGGESQPGGRLTISIGIASLRENESTEELLERADEALYDAKHKGRNQSSVSNYPPTFSRPRTSSLN
ncbi:MAG: diguanylate cyclase [Polyangiales bacterium]